MKYASWKKDFTKLRSWLNNQNCQFTQVFTIGLLAHRHTELVGDPRLFLKQLGFWQLPPPPHTQKNSFPYFVNPCLKEM